MSSSGAKAGGYPLDLAGATNPTRYVGGTAGGAPTAGTFEAGDYVVDDTGKLWVCTTAGAPGAWTEVGGGPVSLSTYSMVLTGGNYALATGGANTMLVSPATVPAGTWIMGATLVVSSATAGCNVELWATGNPVTSTAGPYHSFLTCNVANGIYTATAFAIITATAAFQLVFDVFVSAAATAYETNPATTDTNTTGFVALKVA